MLQVRQVKKGLELLELQGLELQGLELRVDQVQADQVQAVVEKGSEIQVSVAHGKAIHPTATLLDGNRATAWHGPSVVCVV